MARSLAILALAGAAAAAWPEEDNVVVLDDKNFDQFLKETPLTIVEFYAPWCGHCKQLAPVFEEVAEKLQKKKIADPPIPCVKVGRVRLCLLPTSSPEGCWPCTCRRRSMQL